MLASSHQFNVEVTGSQYPGWSGGPYEIEGSQAGMLGDRFEGIARVCRRVGAAPGSDDKGVYFRIRWDAEMVHRS